jgi:amino acid adenylation domain-containing protein
VEPGVRDVSGGVRLLHEAFERYAAHTPEAPALEYRGQWMSYRELEERANRLAWHLQRLGIGPDCPVVVLLKRSPDLVIALLAVLKAGGAYVPLDASCPPERVRSLLADAQAPVLITHSGLAPAAASGAGAGLRLCMDDLPEEVRSGDSRPVPSETRPEHLAYIIYTSGSTGRPKGVAVEHRQVSAYLDWIRALMGSGGCGSPVQSSVSFDLAITSLWVPLVTGRTVFLVPEEGALESFAEMVRQNRDFTLLKVTPSHLEALDRMLGDADVSRAARCLVVGGEAFPPGLAARWRRRLPGARIFNEYGPTETTVGCTLHEVSEIDLGGASLPIGREVPGVRVLVVDAQQRPVPDGEPGELWVGGVQVARGYWRDSERTASRFVSVPLKEGSAERFYQTGDRVRRRADGTLEYLGRLDRQVKIRGHRVEPDEIEAVLATCPGLRSASVDTRRGSDETLELVAYLTVIAGAKLTASSVRRHLSRQLPSQLIPSRFILLDALPMTSNGKVDRRALEGVAGTVLPDDGGGDPPRTPLEKGIAGIWAEMLRVENFGIRDSFFALGGNSLLALRVIAAVQTRFGSSLRLADFLGDPTVAGMSGRIAAHPSARRAQPIVRTTTLGAVPATPEQVNLWLTQQLVPDPSAYNVVYASRLKGQVHPELLDRALQTVAGRQDILRTRFRLEGEELLQEVAMLAGPRAEWEDLRAVPFADREAALARTMSEAARTEFDLETAPLWRCRVLTVDAGDQVLVITLHHALVDEWSMHLLLSELELAYREAAGEAVVFPELPIRFADFALWNQARLAEADLGAQEAYWRRSLEGYRGTMSLPSDRPAPARPTGRGCRRRGGIPRDVRVALQRLAAEEAVSEFVVALAGWMAWLGCRTGEREVLIGTPVAQRERPEVQHLAGLFLRTLPLRATVDSGQSFRSLVRRMGRVVSESFAHDALSLVQILALMPRLPAAPSLPAGFALIDRRWSELRLPGTTGRAVPIHTNTAKFPLLLLLAPDLEGGWSAVLEYSVDLFSPERAEVLLGEFLRFLCVVSEDPNAVAFGAGAAHAR